MATVNFFLKEPKLKKETLIYLFFSFNNKRLKYSTGQKIHPDFWNTENQRARETKKFSEYPEFNAYLSKIESTVNTIYRKFLNDDLDITTKLIKNELDIQLNKTSKKNKETLFEFIDNYIKEQKNIKRNTTLKDHKDAFNTLKKYCTENNCSIDFEDINLAFYNSYINYMTLNLHYAQNTIANKIKHLKVFLNEATERGINKNIEFKSRKFKKVTEETDKIYLNKVELEKMYKLDLSDNPLYDKVRDTFILGCFTGLRFSDFAFINNENIIDNNKIRVKTSKTSETVVIPVHPFVKEILKKYNGSIQDPPNNQIMNINIKEVGKLAGLTEKVSISITRGGKMERNLIEKHDLISTHTARRSFATNLYLADVPAITIMKITGHKTEKSFLLYIRISQEENANKLINHPFFN